MNLRILFVVAGLGLMAACTGGVVVNSSSGYSRVFDATVVWAPNAPGSQSWTTTSGTNGEFRINPYDAFAPGFNQANYIPPGLSVVQIILPSTPPKIFVYVLDHEYSATCNTPVNGSTQKQACSEDIFDVGSAPTLSQVPDTEGFAVNSNGTPYMIPVHSPDFCLTKCVNLPANQNLFTQATLDCESKCYQVLSNVFNTIAQTTNGILPNIK